jgi:hypothetical protein
MSARRFLAGLTDIPGSDPMGNLGILDPRKYMIYHEDFSMFGTGGAVADTTWYNGQYGFSASPATTITLAKDADVTTIALSISNTATDTSWGRVQGYPGNMILTAGKKAYMETSIEVTAATLNTHFWVVGLTTPEAVGDTSNITDDTVFTLIADDSWCFFKDGNQANVYGRSGENDVNTDTLLFTTQVTATWYKFACYFDGTDMYWYTNDVLVGISTPVAIPVTPVAPTFMHLSQKAETLVTLVDYLTVILEQ